MAPFRASGRSNRSGRSQADHDIFEGLPIKQWRHSETTVGLPQVTGELKAGDNAWPELPMPRDSHMLSETTQALLREARRPRLAKRKEPAEDEKGEDDEEGEKEVQTGFLAKKWSQVPAHLEEPEREYLAKRRKGLPSLHAALALQAATNIPITAATRKAKVMKSDGQGNTTIYEVLVPEGQVVEGEVKEDAEMPDAPLERAAPGTVIEGVGIANAEGIIVANDLLQPQPVPRRRNMPPKRVKKGGPGRGRKKVMFTAEGQAAASTTGGTGALNVPAADGAVAGDAMDVDSVPKEGEDGGDDEGEEEDDDDDDREDGELSDGEIENTETLSRPTDSAFTSEANDTAPTAEVTEADAEDSEPLATAANGDATTAEPMEDVQTESVIVQAPTETADETAEQLSTSETTHDPVEPPKDAVEEPVGPVLEEQTEVQSTAQAELDPEAQAEPEALAASQTEAQSEAEPVEAVPLAEETQDKGEGSATTSAEGVTSEAPGIDQAGPKDEDDA